MRLSSKDSRRLLLLSLFVVGTAVLAHAQICVGDVELKTQEEVAAFNCSEVMGNLLIGDYDNEDDVRDLTPLLELTSIGGYLSIGGSAVLKSLDGLNNVSTVGGNLTFNYNPSLESLDALESLTSVGGLYIQRNDALDSLVGLEGVTSVDVSILIRDNAVLESLAGLDSVSSIGNYLLIDDNVALRSMAGLENLASVGNFVRIVGNTSLESLTSLERLASVEGGLIIESNDALVSLSGLEGLASIGGRMSVRDNATLESLSGLESITSVGARLGIHRNATLRSLAGLENLTFVGGDLSVSLNTALRDCACGLSGLISDQPPVFSGVKGSVSISDNDSSGVCNSPQDVLEAFALCKSVASEPSGADPPADPLQHLTLDTGYPNPFAEVTTVAFTLPNLARVRLAVFDALGREVAVLLEEPVRAGQHAVRFDAGRMASGTYVVRLVVGKEAWTQRLTLVR